MEKVYLMQKIIKIVIATTAILPAAATYMSENKLGKDQSAALLF